MKFKKKDGGIEEINLLEMFKYLWKHKITMVALALIGGILAYGYTAIFIPPRYQSYVQIYVNNTNNSQNTGYISSGEISAAVSLVNTYGVILKSETTLSEVAQRLGGSYTAGQLSGMTSVKSVSSTQIFRVTVTAGSPEAAQKIANTIAEVLPGRIAEVVDGSSVRIVDYARLSQAKVSPNTRKNVEMGLGVGLGVGLAFFLLRFILDDRVHDAEYITQTYDLPILGSIPDAYEANLSKGKKYYGSRNGKYGYGYGYDYSSSKGAKK